MHTDPSIKPRLALGRAYAQISIFWVSVLLALPTEAAEVVFEDGAEHEITGLTADNFVLRDNPSPPPLVTSLVVTPTGEIDVVDVDAIDAFGSSLVTIDGGSVTVTGVANGFGTAVDLEDQADLVVRNAMVTAPGDVIDTEGSLGNDVVITDSDLTSTGEFGRVIDINRDNATVAITDSTLSAAGNEVIDISGSEGNRQLTIVGGSLTTTDDFADAIDASGGTDTTISITNATIVSENGSGLDASGSNRRLTLDIVGGSFTGGDDGIEIDGVVGNRVTITGADVASGGQADHAYDIGSDDLNLTITDGSATAIDGTALSFSVASDVDVLLTGSLNVLSQGAEHHGIFASQTSGLLSITGEASILSEGGDGVWIRLGNGPDLTMTLADDASITSEAAGAVALRLTTVNSPKLSETSEVTAILTGGTVRATGDAADALEVGDDVIVTISNTLLEATGSELVLIGGETSVLGIGFAVDGAPADFGEVLNQSGTLTGTHINGSPISYRFSREDGRLFLVSGDEIFRDNFESSLPE